MADEIISYHPTEGLTYEPGEDRYWDLEMLDMEVSRVFEVCHGCRRCASLCGVFPRLFDALDHRHDGDVRKLSAADIEEVMEDCNQCGLCELQCPYTPREGHDFQLDLPRLVHRYKAVRTRRRGMRLRDRVLGDPGLLGTIARGSLGLVNGLNKVRLHRRLVEQVFGIHRSKDLPDFVSVRFESWARRAGWVRNDPAVEAVVFATCHVDSHEPEIGRDTLDVLQKNQVECSCVAGAGCCGRRAWEAGDLRTVRRLATDVLDRLGPYAEAGAKVLVLQPACALMLRDELPRLVDHPQVGHVASVVMDPGEFLWSIRKEDRFNTDFRSAPPGGTVAYHAPCHLRTQRVGFRGRDLLRRIPGTTVTTVLECCGHDGTFALKVESFDASVARGQAAFEAMRASGSHVWASECANAGLQFRQHAGRQSMHPMSVLARAYREDGFRDLPIRVGRPASGSKGPAH